MKSLVKATTLLCGILIGNFGCMGNSTDTTTRQFRELFGKELSLGQDLLMHGRDSSSTYTVPKIVITVDPTKECTACEMELRNWYIQKEDLYVRGLNMPIIFILQQAKINVELDSTLRDLSFYYILDPKGIFIHTNELTDFKTMNTFLLDKDNRVVLVGSPIGNPKMWELYKSTITRLVENGGTLPD